MDISFYCSKHIISSFLYNTNYTRELSHHSPVLSQLINHQFDYVKLQNL